MAGRSAISFKEDPLLQEYLLDRVAATGKTLGVGAYGSVIEVTYQSTICAAKRVHEIFLDPNNQGLQDVVQKYRRECQLMASIRHPNVTQFLGLCFIEDARLPLLVMERLEMSLHDLLECAPNLSLPLKLSVLHDTCSGLVYLHSRRPSIVHRDLTARNILITSSMSAKITDFGCSRMIDIIPGQLAKVLSNHPGTKVYMPPEALNESHRYGPPVDVFSFGHLALYVITQVFPGELLAPTYLDPSDRECTIARTEVECRQPYMEQLEAQVGRSHPALVDLVKQCLHNAPERRPSTEEVLSRVRDVKLEVEGAHGNITRQLNITNILVLKELKQKDRTILEMQMNKQRFEVQALCEKQSLELNYSKLLEEKLELEKRFKLLDENQYKGEKLTEKNQYETEKRLENEMNQIVAEKDQFEGENIRLVAEKNQFQLENIELKRGKELLATENSELKEWINQLDEQKNQLDARINQLEAQKNQLDAELKGKQLYERLTEDTERLQLQETRGISGSRDPIERKIPVVLSSQLDWKCGPDMPFTMNGHIQSVKLEGTVYVGGGSTDRDEDHYVVMAFNTQSCQWYKLPPYEVRGFAMATVNNTLVLVGGIQGDFRNVYELGVLKADSNGWIHPFPKMPTSRSHPSVTSYRHWLIVAGGSTRVDSMSVVEILDVDSKRWYSGPSTPIPWHRMKSTVINNTWYLMGGSQDSTSVDDVYCGSLDALVSHLEHGSPLNKAVWKKIPGHEHYHSCSPLGIRGILLAVGGQSQQNEIKSTLCRYVSETDKWIIESELPCALKSCTCIVISEKLYVFGGWDGRQRVSSIYYCNITN